VTPSSEAAKPENRLGKLRRAKEASMKEM